jgi:hypothetical protein
VVCVPALEPLAVFERDEDLEGTADREADREAVWLRDPEEVEEDVLEEVGDALVERVAVLDRDVVTVLEDVRDDVPVFEVVELPEEERVAVAVSVAAVVIVPVRLGRALRDAVFVGSFDREAFDDIVEVRVAVGVDVGNAAMAARSRDRMGV